MKHTFILAMSALLLCACNESVKYGSECTNGDIPRCTDDYHFVKCDNGSNKTESCCSDAEIAAGTCGSVCMMRAAGAVCEKTSMVVEQPECGNGKLESGEQCDSQDLNGNSCVNKYGVNAKGQAVCDPVTCQVRYDGCQPDTTKCGDGIIDSGEDCDGDALNDHSCAADVAGSSGNLKCTDTCKFDYSDCHVPTCGNGRIDEGETCDTAIPLTLSCSDVTRGATGQLSCNNLCQIDVSACEIPKLSERCDISGDLNNGGCDDKGRHVFCENGLIHVNECAYRKLDGDGVCAVFELGDGNWISGCAGFIDECDNPGEIKRRCAMDSEYKTALQICRHDAISGKNFWVETEDPRYEACTYSCSRETGTCKKLSDLDTASCNQFDPPKCEGNVAINCESTKYGYKYEASECSEACVIFDYGEDYIKQAACVFKEDDKCQVGDSNTRLCYGDTVRELECNKVLDHTDGYLIGVGNEKCENGCDPDNGECVKFDANEGKRCTTRSETKCLGDDMLLYCNENKVYASRVCIGKDGKTGVCIEEDKSANCYETCTEEGATRSSCITTSENAAYTSTETCTNINGVLVYKETSTENCAAFGCKNDNSGCIKFRDDDGTNCSADIDKDACFGNIVSWCNHGRKTSVDCKYYGSDTSCAILEDGSAYCMETCDVLDEEKKVCVYDDEENGYITKHKKCITASNGVKVFNSIETESCSEGCNETWDACVHCTPGDVRTMCSETYGENGINLYLECKSNGGTPYWDYKIVNRESVYEICPDGCNATKTACNKVLDIQGEACDSSFQSRCIDGYRVECANSGFVSAETCPSDTSCHTSPAMGNTNCSEPCTQPQAPQIFCVTFPEDNSSYLYQVSCERVDGGLYDFQNVLQQCAKGCNSSRTACK